MFNMDNKFPNRHLLQNNILDFVVLYMHTCIRVQKKSWYNIPVIIRHTELNIPESPAHTIAGGVRYHG